MQLAPVRILSMESLARAKLQHEQSACLWRRPPQTRHILFRPPLDQPYAEPTRESPWTDGAYPHEREDSTAAKEGKYLPLSGEGVSGFYDLFLVALMAKLVRFLNNTLPTTSGDQDFAVACCSIHATMCGQRVYRHITQMLLSCATSLY